MTCSDQLTVGYENKMGIKNYSKVFHLNNWKIESPFIEVGKTVGKSGLGECLKISFNMINLKRLLNLSGNVNEAIG